MLYLLAQADGLWIASEAVRGHVARDVESGLRSGHVHGVPTLFMDGAIHSGGDAANTLLERLTA
jgi:hypothetical protein